MAQTYEFPGTLLNLLWCINKTMPKRMNSVSFMLRDNELWISLESTADTGEEHTAVEDGTRLPLDSEALKDGGAMLMEFGYLSRKICDDLGIDCFRPAEST